MSLLNNQNQEQVDHSVILAERIGQAVFQQWESLKNTQMEIYHLLWHSSIATPQEILDELGTNAVSLFQLGSDNVALILKYKPDFHPKHYVPVKDFTINPNGTVTISEDYYENYLPVAALLGQGVAQSFKDQYNRIPNSEEKAGFKASNGFQEGDAADLAWETGFDSIS